MKKYIVTVNRITCSQMEIAVFADSKEKAKQWALESAGNFTFSETMVKNAEYEIENVEMAKEPLTVYWRPFTTDLNQMFGHASFNSLDKMGYHIWNDVDYDVEDVGGQYETLLLIYKKKWLTLTPNEKAHKLMQAGKLSEDQLAQLCIEKEYEYFQ